MLCKRTSSVRDAARMFQNVAEESAKAKPSTPQSVRKMPNRKSIQTDQPSQRQSVWSASPCQYRLVYSLLLLLTYWKQIWRKTTKNPKSHHKSFHRRQSPYSAISTPTRTCVKVPMIIWVSPNEPPKTPPPTHIRNHNHTHANTDCLTFYNYLYHAPTYPNKLGKLSTTHTHFKLLI